MGTKAEIFKADALSAGWKAEIKVNGDVSTVVAKREADGAVMSISWKGDACLNECILTVGGNTRKLRNAAACRRELSGDTDAPKQGGSKKKTSPPKAPAPRQKISDEEDAAADEQPRIRPPLWGMMHADAPERDIIKAVLGRRITWLNSLKRELETATVLPKPNQGQLRIEKSPVNGRRVLSFAAAEEGIRSVYIERIVEVA